jgi:outer membrane protein OmpA-like peptidoglycan-associated protein
MRALVLAGAVLAAAAGCHAGVPAKSPAAIDIDRDAGAPDGPDEPEVPPLADTDHDGVLDRDDDCPTESEDLDGFADNDGCPDPDNDLDHILDANDKCPNEPETYNGIDDDDGCPDYASPAPRAPLPEIKPGPIAFDEGSAIVRGESAAILDSMAAFIKVVPGFLGVTVAGHAAAYERRDLAAARVAAVRRYLVKRGVPPQSIRPTPVGVPAICDPGTRSPTDRRADVCIDIGR